MSVPIPTDATRRYHAMDRGRHSLHECRTVAEFSERFEAVTGNSLHQLAARFVSASAPQAVFAVGSLALGMGSSGSDVDLIALVDSKSALLNGNEQAANTGQHLEFQNAGQSLLAGVFMTMNEGVMVDLHVALTPEIHAVYNRLQRRGPELSETEVRTLGRLSTGWLLWQTEGYLESRALTFKDQKLHVYCATQHFVSALHEETKAGRALDCDDIPLALNHARGGVEQAYLAFLASEGLSYLGTKWLAQIGYARGAAERVSKHPLLKDGVHLLFPHLTERAQETTQYLRAVSEFIRSMRDLIERKTLFRIAFHACPQIYPV